jgi:hypothetical protein
MEVTIMLKKDKSVMLTQFIIRLCYVLLTALAIALPVLLKKGIFNFEILSNIKSYIMLPFYAVVPAGYVALICLDKILQNIKNDLVFDNKNVKLLNIISWACIWAGMVGLITFVVILLKSFMFETMIILSAGEFFMALVVKVVKNVFVAAIEIKEENDLTV